MEFVILGLLHMKDMTAYEIGAFINKNFILICSGSAGSIQIGLKKLLSLGCITMKEFVENSVNKKVYSLAEEGKVKFDEWVKNPMKKQKAKNMELAKLFFMGLAPKQKRFDAIEEYIASLHDEISVIESIKEAICQNILLLEQKQENALTRYQIYTLEHGIDLAKFEIEWYSNLLKEIKIEDFSSER